MMTSETIELCMLRDVCLHLLVHLRMAYVTALLQGTVGREVHWSVRLVTFRALCQTRSVNLPVTGLTFGKDIFIFYPSRAIEMELFVTSLTVYPVFTTVVS
jgi:hypothetical protein